jgi:hypothetical protein
MDEQRMRVIVPASDVDAVETLVRSHGARSERLTHRAIGAETVALVVIGTAVVLGTVQSAIERFRGGQVFDLRQDAPSPFYRSRDLHYGMIAVIAGDGSLRVRVFEPSELLDKVAGIVRSASADKSRSIADVEKEIRVASGKLDNAIVEIERTDT